MYTCTLETTIGDPALDVRLDFAAAELSAKGCIWEDQIPLDREIDPNPCENPLTDNTLEQLATMTWQRTMKWLVATGQSPRVYCTKVTITSNKWFQVAYEPNAVVVKRGFTENVNTTEMARITKWTDEQLAKHPFPSSTPRFEFTFTHCGIGVALHMKDLVTGESADNLTDLDSW